MTAVDLKAPAYCEEFATPDEHPAGTWGFLCSVCQQPVDDRPCPDHAPVDVPGLRLLDCQATPRHWVWVHDRQDHGIPCPYCRLAGNWGWR